MVEEQAHERSEKDLALSDRGRDLRRLFVEGPALERVRDVHHGAHRRVKNGEPNLGAHLRQERDRFPREGDRAARIARRLFRRRESGEDARLEGRLRRAGGDRAARVGAAPVSALVLRDEARASLFQHRDELRIDVARRDRHAARERRTREG